MKPVDIDIDAKHKAVQGEERMIEGEQVEEGRGSGVSVWHTSIINQFVDRLRSSHVARA